jgi:hypothetical protein
MIRQQDNGPGKIFRQLMVVPVPLVFVLAYLVGAGLELSQRMEVSLVCLLWVMLSVVISLVGVLSTTREAQQRRRRPGKSSRFREPPNPYCPLLDDILAPEPFSLEEIIMSI